ncbi:MAG: hypothetical protein Q8N14_03895 [Candidatus Omnitrophota bacterium]|nr:hypothetical protein [Candidatus Omnitrophota bacterium]
MKETIRFLIILLIILLSKNNLLFGAPDKNMQFKPVLTSENFDNRVTKIQLKFIQEGKENIKDVGTGFFVNDGEKFIYLVSAGHIFKESLKNLIDNKGKMVFFQKFESKDGKLQNTITYEIDLIDCWKKNLLRFNESNDLGIIKLREFIKKEEISKEIEGKIEKSENQEVKSPMTYSASINISSDDGVVKYENIKKAEDIYFFGYPELPTLQQFDKTHFLNPVIRKGIVSKLIDNKKIIIEGFASRGNSGSPVFVRREYISLGGYKIEFRFIGLITGYFPVFFPKPTDSRVFYSENAGLALVESVDNILEIIEEFRADDKKDSN